MSPDELLERLEALGVHIARRTLTDWTQRGVIREPVRGSRGRGKGRFTEYQDPWAVGDAVAAWMLARGLGRTKWPHPFEWYVRQAATIRLMDQPWVKADDDDDFSPALTLTWQEAAWLNGFVRGVLGLHIGANVCIGQLWARAPWGRRVCYQVRVTPEPVHRGRSIAFDVGLTSWASTDMDYLRSANLGYLEPYLSRPEAEQPWRKWYWPPRYVWQGEDDTREVLVPTFAAPQFGVGGEEAAWFGLAKDGEPAWADLR